MRPGETRNDAMSRIVMFVTIIVSVAFCTTADARHRHHHHRLGYGSVAPASERDGPAGWSTYVDPAAGTSLDYPANVFSVKEGAPEQGTGQRFRSADGRAKLTVYELPNSDNDTPRSYLRRHLLVDPSRFEYKRVTDSFFVVSGVRDGQTFYSRCNFAAERNGAMHCVYLEYPERETKAWDTIVTRISRTLHAPRSDQAQR